VSQQSKQDWQCAQDICLIRTDVIDHVNTGDFGYDSPDTLFNLVRATHRNVAHIGEGWPRL